VTTAAVIGAGELGGAVAHAIASREAVSEVIIVDSAGGAAAGKALDLQQMGAISGWHTRVRGSSDFSDVIGCAVCVIADCFGSASIEWQGDEGRALLERLAGSLGDAPVVFAGAAQTPLLSAAVAGGYRRPRIIGSSTEAFASSVRAMVALEARCAPAEVSLSVLGTPPAGLVVAWSEAAIGGHAVDRIVSTVELNRIQLRVSRLWPPGPLTLGLAAAAAADAIIRSSRRAFSLMSVLDGELGVRGCVAAVPTFLHPAGIAGTRVPSLSTREQILLETALASPQTFRPF
jgi:malate dehydrogenase